jgi:arylsulfatase A-like enzyme
VFTSDHGFHMGEKDLLIKHTTWEESTRVPFVMSDPRGAASGAVCDHPVSLVDLYPTLADLCGLPSDPNAGGNGTPLDGSSMRPLLDDPEGEWGGPDVAVTAVCGTTPVEIGEPGKREDQQFTVRSRHWRYVLYSNGDEELYDHRSDPHEWNNLAGDSAHAATQADLRNQLLGITGRVVEWSPCPRRSRLESLARSSRRTSTPLRSRSPRKRPR